MEFMTGSASLEREALTMFRRMTVWGLVVALCPVLILGQSSESGQIAGQPAKHEARKVDGLAAERPPENGGFEMGKVGMQPAGWKVPDIPGYRVTRREFCVAIATPRTA
jgi:hypothetical protein